jgi:hypothetical protein
MFSSSSVAVKDVFELPNKFQFLSEDSVVGHRKKTGTNLEQCSPIANMPIKACTELDLDTFIANSNCELVY